MSETKHTPTPWKAVEAPGDPNCVVIYAAGNEAVASAWNLMGPRGDATK